MTTTEQRHSEPVTDFVRLPARGQTSIAVAPPAPCGLEGCVAELHVTVRYNMTRVHLDAEQRAELITALRGRLPL